MKRTAYILLFFVLFGVCLLGCSDQATQGSLQGGTKPENPIFQDATSPFIQEIMSTLSMGDTPILEDQVLAETDEYVFYRKDGQCYLSFKAGNARLGYTPEELKEGAPMTVHFEKFEEMYQWLQNPQLSDRDRSVIQHSFALHEENGFLMPDPACVVILDLPQGYHVENAEIGAKRWGFEFLTDEKLPSGRYGGGWIDIIDEEAFARELADFYRYQRGHADYDTTYTIEENNATVFEFNKDTGIRRVVQYCLETENGILFVEEPRLDSGSLSTGMKIFGCQNGIYFTLRVHYTDPEQLLDLAKDLRIVRYEP